MKTGLFGNPVFSMKDQLGGVKHSWEHVSC
jgi:hypothetical protein